LEITQLFPLVADLNFTKGTNLRPGKAVHHDERVL